MISASIGVIHAAGTIGNLIGGAVERIVISLSRNSARVPVSSCSTKLRYAVFFAPILTTITNPNPSLASQRFAPAATHSARGNGASRDGTTGRWTSPPPRTTRRLSKPPPLLIVPIKLRSRSALRPLCGTQFADRSNRAQKPKSPTNFVPSYLPLTLLR